MLLMMLMRKLLLLQKNNGEVEHTFSFVYRETIFKVRCWQKEPTVDLSGKYIDTICVICGFLWPSKNYISLGSLILDYASPKHVINLPHQHLESLHNCHVGNDFFNYYKIYVITI